jgi:hypothetical protein
MGTAIGFSGLHRYLQAIPEVYEPPMPELDTGDAARLGPFSVNRVIAGISHRHCAKAILDGDDVPYLSTEPRFH